MKIIPKPAQDEYPAYASMYIDLIPSDGLVLRHLEENFHLTKDLILSLSKEKLLYSYAPGKWTIKEVLVHITDDERIYAYRALRFARGDKTELPGFEQDNYALHSNANKRNLNSILEEFEAVRKSTIALFNGLDNETLSLGGIADGSYTTVRALAYHIAGHEAHHLSIIKQRYL